MKLQRSLKWPPTTLCCLAFLLSLLAPPLPPHGVVAAEERIPLVLLTVTADNTGSPTLGKMPPLTDDLGNENPFVTDGVNDGRDIFSVQEILSPADSKPTKVSYPYNLDGESGQINCTLNQYALEKVYLYRIVLPGLQCTRALLTSPLGNDQFFIFEQLPAESNTSLTMMASGGPVARLVVFEGNNIAFNMEINGAHYAVDPSIAVEMTPSNLITGETQTVWVSLLDVYGFADRQSFLEMNPIVGLPAQPDLEPPMLNHYELLIYPWADLTLWSDPELTTKSEQTLRGGESMLAIDVEGYENVVAVMDGPPGAETIVGYIPKDVKDIIYRRL